MICLDARLTPRRVREGRLPLRLWNCAVDAATNQIAHIFLYYIIHSLAHWQRYLPKVLYTADMEGITLIPSGHQGLSYFWIKWCHYYLRSVSKELEKTLDGMLLSNLLLEHLGKWWMGKILRCVLYYASGCTNSFGGSCASAQDCHWAYNIILVLSSSSHGYRFSNRIIIWQTFNILIYIWMKQDEMISRHPGKKTDTKQIWSNVCSPQSISSM